MSVQAVPTLSVAGVPIATGPVAGAAPDVVAIDKLGVTWGRKTLLDSPTPSTSSLTVRDVSPRATFARRTDLKGAAVVVGWSTGTDAGTSFRGRVTDVEVLPRGAGRPGFTVRLVCSSKEVDAANYTAPEGTAWPAETASVRLGRIRDLMPFGLYAGGIELPNRAAVGLVDVADPGLDFDGYPVGPADVGGKDALSLLRELWRSLSPAPLIYDPAADSLAFIRSRTHQYDQNAGGTLVGRLVAVNGKLRVQPYAALQTTLDAALVPLTGPLAQRLESTLTRVEVKWWDTAAAKQATASYAIVTAAAELAAGRRVLSVDSILADSALAAQLAGQWSRLASQAGEPTLAEPMLYRSARAGGFADDTAAGILLAGRERPAEIYVGRSWVTRVGQRPLYGIVGGSIAYAGGEWELQLQPAPVLVNDPIAKAITANGAANSAAVKLSDVHDSVSVGDLKHVNIGAGFNAETQPWGN